MLKKSFMEQHCRRLLALSLALISLHALAAGPLTLDQAVELAAKHAPQVQAGQYKQEAAAADLDRAGRLPDPQLQFGIQNLDAQGSGAFNPNGGVASVASGAHCVLPVAQLANCSGLAHLIHISTRSSS